MEYLEGETLAERLSRQKPRSSAGSEIGPGTAAGPRSPQTVTPPGPMARAPLPLDETLRIATQLADALTAAHRAGIVHRDLKPGNIMLTRSGVKVLDFGLAKLRPSREQAEMRVRQHQDGVATDRRGVLLGTVPYMAPEQLEGHGVDGRTDIFAFGAIVYEMAAGRRAFAGDSQASLIAAILEREPEPISGDQPVTPPGLERLVRKCLAKDPDARWQAASDIADELRWLSTGDAVAAVSPAASAWTSISKVDDCRCRAGPRRRGGCCGVAEFAKSQPGRSAPRDAVHAGDVRRRCAGRRLVAGRADGGLRLGGMRTGHASARPRSHRGQSLEIWKGDEGRLNWGGCRTVRSWLSVVATAIGARFVSRFGGAPRLITRLGMYVRRLA